MLLYHPGLAPRLRQLLLRWLPLPPAVSSMYHQRPPPHPKDFGSSSSLGTLPQQCRQFTFSEIQLATQYFDESLVIGRGGFGKVYKGTIMTDGSNLLTVAIKRLDSASDQGAPEFWAEVKMLSKLRHCHLLSLIGYCDNEQEMILVYEYMSLGTLEDHLHKCRYPLTWVRRLKILIDAARGLDYLHTGTDIKHGVVHRDVKSSNILLHNTWTAKISDFGLSKICPKNQQSTYVNTFVKGTFGYLDPDYFYTGKLTRKSDVYAFGVVMFEALTGKRAVDKSLGDEQWGLIRWVQDSIKDGRLKQIVDIDIRGKLSPKCLKEFARLANRCLHSHPKDRPTISEVVVGLESILALQEKAKKALQPASVPILPSEWETPGEGKSLKSLELFFGTVVGGENRMLRRFGFNTITDATENFSKAYKIMEHGYGTTYKGRLPGGQVKAIVDVYSKYSRIKLCMKTASILIELEHENLAQILGYCIEGKRLFLVYDFAPYATLDQLVSDPMCTLLDWNKRRTILLKVARVLLYLHKYAPIRIIHRNVTPGNILLNENLDPKLSGFWVAVAINETDLIEQRDVRAGTIGYIAPEYLNGGHLSTKADVYSFGMSVLTTLSGRNWIDNPNRDNDFLRFWREGTYSNIIDPRIEADSSSITRFIDIGMLCTQGVAMDDDIRMLCTQRPTMEEVVGMLDGSSSIPLHVLKMPAIMHTSMDDDRSTSMDGGDYDTSAVEEFISDLCSR